MGPDIITLAGVSGCFRSFIKGGSFDWYGGSKSFLCMMGLCIALSAAIVGLVSSSMSCNSVEHAFAKWYVSLDCLVVSLVLWVVDVTVVTRSRRDL